MQVVTTSGNHVSPSSQKAAGSAAEIQIKQTNQPASEFRDETVSISLEGYAALAADTGDGVEPPKATK